MKRIRRAERIKQQNDKSNQGGKKIKITVDNNWKVLSWRKEKSLLLIKETKLGDGGIICKLKYTEDDPLCEGWCIKQCNIFTVSGFLTGHYLAPTWKVLTTFFICFRSKDNFLVSKWSHTSPIYTYRPLLCFLFFSLFLFVCWLVSLEFFNYRKNLQQDLHRDLLLLRRLIKMANESPRNNFLLILSK